MNAEEVRALIESELGGGRVSVDGGEGRFGVTVIGDLFEGLSRVRRQQRVNRCLREALDDGRIHAVSIQTYTNAEWAARDDAR